MYPDAMLVRDARARYFERNGFSEAQYSAPWVKLQVGPLPLAFPNSRGRQAAVRLHDLHHVATGYATTWTGEAEIGAWEIGAGCGRYGAAWLLNLSAFAIGIAVAPRRVFRAFVRGRRSRSLYRREFGDDLLVMSVGALRRMLAVDRPPPVVRAGDVVAFGVALTASLGVVAAMLSPVALLLWLVLS